MKRVLAFGILCGLALTGELLACGDKLVVVGRGMRPQRMNASPQRGALLLYASSGGSVSKILEEGRFRKEIERAGHRVRSVATQEELHAALGTGSYDLVLTDIKTVPQVEVEARAGSSKATVLPTLYNPSDAELAAARDQFQCVLGQSPNRQQDYLAVVNEALALRAKESQSQKKK